MFRLDRHIEVLLMRYDCVILPRFGGFVKHHVCAHRDAADGVLLPPKEMVGFNPQLTINDSLLVQSYIEAYDYSYPEALSIVEEDIHALRSTLHEQGVYEIVAVGTLLASAGGTITFEPLPAGLLIPSLYGLAGVETRLTRCFVETAPTVENTTNIVSINDSEPANDTITLSIKRRTLRRVAAACVAIMLIASIPFIGKRVNTQVLTGGSNLTFLYWLLPQKALHAAEETPAAAATEQSTTAAEQSTTAAVEESTTATEQPATATEETPAAAEETPAATEQSTTAAAAQQPAAAEEEPAASVVPLSEARYTIVLASMISKTNATRFVQELSTTYAITAQIIPHGSTYRVVSGGYDTLDAAQQRRREIITHHALADAWVTRTRDL